MYFMYNKLQFLHRENILRVFLQIHYDTFCFHVIIQLPTSPRPSLFVRQQDKEGGGAGRDWRKLNCCIFFKMASLRLPLFFSISQPGEDAVSLDTAERRHSLPLQACPDRLTVKATPDRPGCGKP